MALRHPLAPLVFLAALLLSGAALAQAPPASAFPLGLYRLVPASPNTPSNVTECPSTVNLVGTATGPFEVVFNPNRNITYYGLQLTPSGFGNLGCRAADFGVTYDVSSGTGERTFLQADDNATSFPTEEIPWNIACINGEIISQVWRYVDTETARSLYSCTAEGYWYTLTFARRGSAFNCLYLQDTVQPMCITDVHPFVNYTIVRNSNTPAASICPASVNFTGETYAPYTTPSGTLYTSSNLDPASYSSLNCAAADFGTTVLNDTSGLRYTQASPSLPGYPADVVPFALSCSAANIDNQIFSNLPSATAESRYGCVGTGTWFQLELRNAGRCLYFEDGIPTPACPSSEVPLGLNYDLVTTSPEFASDPDVCPATFSFAGQQFGPIDVVATIIDRPGLPPVTSVVSYFSLRLDSGPGSSYARLGCTEMDFGVAKRDLAGSVSYFQGEPGSFAYPAEQAPFSMQCGALVMRDQQFLNPTPTNARLSLGCSSTGWYYVLNFRPNSSQAVGDCLYHVRGKSSACASNVVPLVQYRLVSDSPTVPSSEGCPRRLNMSGDQYGPWDDVGEEVFYAAESAGLGALEGGGCNVSEWGMTYTNGTTGTVLTMVPQNYPGFPTDEVTTSFPCQNLAVNAQVFERMSVAEATARFGCGGEGWWYTLKYTPDSGPQKTCLYYEAGGERACPASDVPTGNYTLVENSPRYPPNAACPAEIPLDGRVLGPIVSGGRTFFSMDMDPAAYSFGCSVVKFALEYTPSEGEELYFQADPSDPAYPSTQAPFDIQCDGGSITRQRFQFMDTFAAREAYGCAGLGYWYLVTFLGGEGAYDCLYVSQGATEACPVTYAENRSYGIITASPEKPSDVACPTEPPPGILLNGVMYGPMGSDSNIISAQWAPGVVAQWNCTALTFGMEVTNTSARTELAVANPGAEGYPESLAPYDVRCLNAEVGEWNFTMYTESSLARAELGCLGLGWWWSLDYFPGSGNEGTRSCLYFDSSAQPVCPITSIALIDYDLLTTAPGFPVTAGCPATFQGADSVILGPLTFTSRDVEINGYEVTFAQNSLESFGCTGRTLTLQNQTAGYGLLRPITTGYPDAFQWDVVCPNSTVAEFFLFPELTAEQAESRFGFYAQGTYLTIKYLTNLETRNCLYARPGITEERGPAVTASPGPPVPTPAPGGSPCFPGQATVELQGVGIVPMTALKVGDRIRVPSDDTSPKFSEIYFFSHKSPGGHSAYVEIITNASTRLLASPLHYIHVSGALKTAASIVPGDVLTNTLNLPEVVISTKNHRAQGIYNPHTLHGDLLVDGVRVSAYTAAVPPVIANILLLPLRLAFRLWGVCVMGGAFDEDLPGVVYKVALALFGTSSLFA